MTIEDEAQPETQFNAKSAFDGVTFKEMRRASVDNAETRNGRDVMSKTLNTFGSFRAKADQKFKVDEKGSGSPVMPSRNFVNHTTMDNYTPL